MERIRVLHIKDKISSDGATSILLNMAIALQDEVRFDFLLYDSEGNDWEWKFEKLGSKFYYVEGSNKNRIIKKIKQFHFYRGFFKDAGYDIVHIDTDDVGRVDVLRCTWRCGVKKRIYHAHNSRSEGSGILSRISFCKRAMQRRIARFSTDMLACSTEAAEWVFSNKYLDSVKIIKNGIDTKKFRFNEESRYEIREQYGLENNYVIGCVARFAEQKNHDFLIDVFSEVVKENPAARLILIGEGKLKESIQKKVDGLNLGNDVIFVGSTDKVEDYMCAMDMYVMPSLFEGFGMVFIEAQASGLYCIASDFVPNEVKVSRQMDFLSLCESPKFWAEKILLETAEIALLKREEAWKEVADAGYDIGDTCLQLLRVYQT